MKYADAYKRCSELGVKASEHASSAERASRAYSANVELFGVAADANDEKGMEEYRNAVHTAVDVMLDSRAMAAKLRLEQITIANSVTDFPQL